MTGGIGGLPPHVATPDPLLYMGDNWITVDFETTTEENGTPLNPDNKLVLAVWTNSDGVHHHFGSEYEQEELLAAIDKADFIVAHNAKFELGWLKRCGLDLHSVVVYDTMIGEYVRGGNRWVYWQLTLDKLAQKYGLGGKMDLIGKMWDEGIDTLDIPASWLLRYCIKDVELTEAIFLKQREILKERNLLPVLYSRCLLTPVLADVEFNGLQLDENKIKEISTEVEDEYARVTAELQDMCEGVPPSQTAAKAEFIYNQLGFEVPKDHRGRPMVTGSGGPSVKADVLRRLRPRNRRQRLFLDKHEEWAGLHSDYTKYLRKFSECCEEAGGLIYGSFNQTSTRTQRLSSTGLRYRVQLQNLNRRFKPLFRARNDGWLVGEMDGAQLEFRAAVHLCRDPVGLADIIEGRDVHAFAAGILSVSRQDAKAHTFKPLYGGSSGTDAQRAYYAAFEERYNVTAKAQREWLTTALGTKEQLTEWGIKFYWPTTTMKPDGYITNKQSIYNYPIQNFATVEIIPLALVCAWHRMKDMRSFIVNTVHDSIIGEVHPDEVQQWHDIAKQCLIEDAYKMIHSLYGIGITVPLGAGVMTGTHWGDKDSKASEVVYTAPRELWEDNARKEGML